MMPMMGPPPPGMMPVGPAPGMKPPMGGHMPMMTASNDETSCSPYDGAHTAWHDSARQIRAERFFFGFVFLFLFQQLITVLSLGVFLLHYKQGFPFPNRIVWRVEVGLEKVQRSLAL